MSSLSTLEEYQSIAATLAFPKGAYIDSKFLGAESGNEFESVNPAIDRIYDQVAPNGDDALAMTGTRK